MLEIVLIFNLIKCRSSRKSSTKRQVAGSGILYISIKFNAAKNSIKND